MVNLGYTVEHLSVTRRDDPADLTWEITVRWDDGHRTTHCTAWNPSMGDRPLPPQQPDPPTAAKPHPGSTRTARAAAPGSG
ncbi:hypothetical protein OU416_09835 [Saccharopolyspora indica]|uniref:hypothetical protein n=1 Tax=Saccharopolyspora indica TaxID=1229659 RepID=UPI0022EB70FD|nr:hypothetical protein [Saccharopolyspora indica]MDA3644356.1 hypothetical protein [Saccharopolyspora indica]